MVRPTIVALGGEGPRALFVPANGFPLPTYRRLFAALRPHVSLEGFALRPSQGERRPDPSVGWETIGKDLRRALERADEPPIVIGHSLGATAAILCAAQAPARLKGLVLVEPAMVGRWVHYALRAVPYRLRQRSIKLVRTTLRRPDTWPNRAAFERHAQRNPVFRHLDRDALSDLADGLLEPHAGGVRLAYSKQWEAHFYATAVWPIPALQRITDMAVVGVRGSPSLFLPDVRWSEVRAAQPRGSFETLDDYGHLLPIEAPGDCAKAILAGLRATSLLSLQREDR